VDPLNLTGVIAPGPRVAALPSRRIEIRDGLISDATRRAQTVDGAPLDQGKSVRRARAALS
jgi:hypothetical protein